MKCSFYLLALWGWLPAFSVSAQVRLEVIQHVPLRLADAPLYLASTLNNWNPGDPNYRFSRDSLRCRGQNQTMALPTTPAAYTLLIDKNGGDFSKAEGIAMGSGLTKTFKASDLNAILLKLGLKPATAGDVDIRVQSAIGPSTVLSSALSSVKVTPYLDKLDLSSTFGIVGSATANGWDGPDQPFYRTDKAGILVAYLMLANSDIKFRQNNDWVVNYGGPTAC